MTAPAATHHQYVSNAHRSGGESGGTPTAEHIF
jgi:hypothetical protein